MTGFVRRRFCTECGEALVKVTSPIRTPWMCMKGHEQAVVGERRERVKFDPTARFPDTSIPPPGYDYNKVVRGGMTGTRGIPTPAYSPPPPSREK